jgi:hypothetical protein
MHTNKQNNPLLLNQTTNSPILQTIYIYIPVDIYITEISTAYLSPQPPSLLFPSPKERKEGKNHITLCHVTVLFRI